jgi:hypothetical protein
MAALRPPVTRVTAFHRAEPLAGAIPHTVPSASRTTRRPGRAERGPRRFATVQRTLPVPPSRPRTVPSTVATKTRAPSVASGGHSAGPSNASPIWAFQSVVSGKIAGSLGRRR